MTISPFWVALVCVTTALGLMREATRKQTWYMRMRWAFMSWPFWVGAYGYYLAWSQNWTPAQISPYGRSVIFFVCLLATGYFAVDFFFDAQHAYLKSRAKRKHYAE